MKSRLILSTMVGIMGLFLMMFSGCYTQLGTTRDEQISQGDDNSTAQSEQNRSTYSRESSPYGSQQSNYVDDDNYYDSYPRYHVGFSYYYPSSYWPSYAFTVAYNNPWRYDSYSSYDPWLCGTPYVTYPWYGNSPYSYYSSGYSGYYSTPLYAYYHYGYSYVAVPVRRTSRNFGTTRDGSIRGATSNTDNFNNYGNDRSSAFPQGGSGFEQPISGGISTRGNNETITQQPARPGGTQRASTRQTDSNVSGGRTDRGVRGASSRGARARGEGNRDNQTPQYRPESGNSAPSSPSYTPPASTGRPNRDAGSSRGAGTQQSGGGNSTRGGNSRGGRP